MADKPVTSLFRILAGTAIGSAMVGFIGSKFMPEPAKPGIELSAYMKAQQAQERIDTNPLNKVSLLGLSTPSANTIKNDAAPKTQDTRQASLFARANLGYDEYVAAFKGDSFRTVPPEVIRAQFVSMARRIVNEPPGLNSYLLTQQMYRASSDVTARAMLDMKKQLGRELSESEQAQAIKRAETELNADLMAAGVPYERLVAATKRLEPLHEQIGQDYQARYDTSTTVQKINLAASANKDELAAAGAALREGIIIKQGDRELPAPEVTESVGRELYGRISGYLSPGAPVRMSADKLRETTELLHGPWGDVWQSKLQEMGITTKQLDQYHDLASQQILEGLTPKGQAATPAIKSQTLKP